MRRMGSGSGQGTFPLADRTNRGGSRIPAQAAGPGGHRHNDVQGLGSTMCGEGMAGLKLWLASRGSATFGSASAVADDPADAQIEEAQGNGGMGAALPLEQGARRDEAANRKAPVRLTSAHG